MSHGVFVDIKDTAKFTSKLVRQILSTNKENEDYERQPTTTTMANNGKQIAARQTKSRSIEEILRPATNNANDGHKNGKDEKKEKKKSSGVSVKVGIQGQF